MLDMMYDVSGSEQRCKSVHRATLTVSFFTIRVGCQELVFFHTFLFFYSPYNANMRINTSIESIKNYQKPLAWLIEMNPEDILCISPVPGGNEGIGYDDWDEE